MFLRREGYPEEGELVFCTVIKIQYHAVTVKLDEYQKQGLIHISEVSPGRIRNIRNYVTEGKKVVCKVIRINHVRGHIDLSLRRVSESQKRNKIDAIKQEQKAEKIIASLAERLKKKPEEIYAQLAEPVFSQYHWIHQAFEEVVENNISLEKLGIKKELAQPLEELVKEKIKPKKVEIIVNAKLKTHDSDGINIIKKAFKKAAEDVPDLKTAYLGAGAYRMVITAKNYKKAEALLKDMKQNMAEFLENNNGEAVFQRQE